MYIAFSCLSLFFLLFFLVLVYHLYLWNMDSSFMSGCRTWVSSYECGFLSQRVVENYFSYTYFILLVFFVIFDLEVSLLLNLPLQGVLYKNLSYYILFLILLCLGFGVEISKGYVDWSY